MSFIDRLTDRMEKKLIQNVSYRAKERQNGNETESDCLSS